MVRFNTYRYGAYRYDRDTQYYYLQSRYHDGRLARGRPKPLAYIGRRPVYSIQGGALGTSDVASSGETWGGNSVNSAAADYAAHLQRPGQMVPLARGSMSLQDLGSLASGEEAEFAVVRMGGQRYLVRGYANGTTIPKGAKLIVHVHPGEGFMGAPSEADLSALEQLGQLNSAIVNESGAWRVFGAGGPSGIVRNANRR